jgi:hypothetical protein
VNAAILLAATAAQAASPSITLTPSQGPEGTTVRVDGSGFCSTASGCSTVQISFARIPEATTSVASNGTFSVTFKVPGGLPFGQQNVEADQTTASGTQLSANKSFFLTISQQSPPPAQSPPAASPTPAPGGSPAPGSPGSPGASPTATAGSPPANPQASPSVANAPGKPTAFPWWALVVIVLVAGAAAVAGLVWRRFRE